MEIHFLDTGPNKYGDCIVCRNSGQLILIDGGHPGDWKDRADGHRRSIPRQIEEVAQQVGPWKFDLLIVTHTHLDHTGCLPKLVQDGTISARWALVADEKYGWGRHRSHDGPKDAEAPLAARRLAAALREDMVPDLSDAVAVRDFMDEAQKQEDAYKSMLQKLQKNGTKVVRYGRDSTVALLKAFKSWNLDILGPTTAHLVKCADLIASSLSDAVQSALATLESDAGRTMSAEQVYVSMMRKLPSDLVDSGSASRPGAALNDMSIVLTLGPKGSKVLLAGDAQFIDPEVPGLEKPMEALRIKTKKAGPFALAKTCHHTSKNAAGLELFNEWGEDVFLVHSGGENDDPAHPAPSVLKLLRERSESKPELWARTDRNHLISCYIESTGAFEVKFEEGELDDFSPNKKKPDEAALTPVVRAEIAQATPEGIGNGEQVEVTIRIPHRQTRVTVTVDVSPGQSTAGPPIRSGGGPDEVPLSELPTTLGRRLPVPLLVATCLPRLASNVGSEAAARAVNMLREAGATVIENLPDPRSQGAYLASRSTVHAALRRDDYVGVVLLGGPDVVRPALFDTLEPSVRQEIDRLNLPINMRDPDDFIVWSDHPFGDTLDRDVPVSRIPDGHSPTLLLRAVAAAPSPGLEAFGLRNRFRPFADHVFRHSIRSVESCLSSSPFSPSKITPSQAGLAGVYLMLHGIDTDPGIFYGEDEDEDFIPAFDLSCLPDSAPGSVIFAGCCWGALTADEIAVRSSTDRPLGQRRASESIPLGYLRRGAAAFIGCTGVHYSPEDSVPDCYGGPMHSHFWDAIREGLPPALALFQARVKYLKELPHGREELFDYAVEYKTYHQFTCLGLGW